MIDSCIVWLIKAALIASGVFVFLLIRALRKGLAVPKKTNALLFLLPVFLIGTTVWFSFFENAGFAFVRLKETRRCDYSRSTLYNKKMRIVRSYDLDGIDNADIFKINGRTPKYALEFKGKEHRFRMPVKFCFPDTAKEQPDLARTFLKTDLPENAGMEFPVILGAILSTIFADVGIITLLMKRFKPR